MMQGMEQGDIKRLASLARIAVSDHEAKTLSHDIDAVLAYVSTVSDIAAANDATKKVGPLHNVLREDAVTNQPGEQTDTLLAEAPHRDGAWLKVKKILNQD